MTFTTDDKYFQDLATLVRSHPTKCLFIVGTGVSRSCAKNWAGDDSSDPLSWRGLIANGIARCKTRNGGFDDAGLRTRFEAAWPESGQPNMQDMLAIADAVAAELGRHGKTEWLRELFGALEADQGKSGPLDFLATMFHRGATIVTTNYDELIERRAGKSLRAVTPTDEGFIPSITGENNAVIHIHGTADRDQVFGAADYSQIVSNEQAQEALRALMIPRHVIYLGCGSGLDDPNFGPLLEWLGARFLKGKGLLSYYVGAQSDFEKLQPRLAGHKTELVALRGHAEFPELIGGLLEALGIKPFDRFGPGEELLGNLMRQIPGDDFDLRPDWSELNNGQIPAHPVESAVKASLDARRIAHLRGDAGAGKTVLGLRLAHAALNAGNNIFWVTMRSETQRAAAAYHLLAKPDSLFVIDDAHTNFPEVQTLIDAFAERDAGDRLLILSTNIGLEQRPVGAKAIELNVEGAVQRWSADPRFLEAIAAYLAERLGKGQTATIPFGAGEQFVATFGARAGAFAIAVAGRLSRADPDPWNVSEADAVSWLQQRLRGWTSAAPAYDNLVYLAGIAAAGSEKWVPVDLLPHPGMAGAIPVKKVLDSGLTRSAKRAPPANLVVRLHQPLVMGPLILKALEKSPSDPRLQVDRLMFDILLEPQSTESIMKPLDDALQAEVANRVSLAMPMFVARSSAVMPFAIRPLLNWLKARDVNLAREFLLQLDTDPGWTDSALLARPALSGAGSLAEIIRQAGQSDDPRSSNFDAFADRLTTAMVRRCDLARDFQARGANIANLERTINLSHSATAAEKVVFLESIWRPYTVSNWLPEPIPGAHPPPPGFQRDTNRFSLGAFLYTTGLYQSESVVELLRRPDLTIVYFKWLARLIKGLDPTFRPPDYSSAAIQLLGAFSVLRVKVASSMLEQLPASKVARIPQEILPHRSTDIVIAPVQRRLWFGIREYVLRLNRELNMPAHLIEQTHALCLAHMTEYPPEVGFSATGYEHTNTLATWLHYALTHHRNRNVVVLKH